MRIKVQKGNKLEGVIEVPGDKSITHRAIILGSIAEGYTYVENFLHAADCESTIDCLQKMGVEIRKSLNYLKIKGRGIRGLNIPQDTLNAGNSGTTIRLLLGVLAGQPFKTTITGDHSLRKRPMRRVIEPLQEMGAEIKSYENTGLAPITIKGRIPLKPIFYSLGIPSAQVKSAIMLAALYAEGETVIQEPVKSRDHTERMLEVFEVKLKSEDNKIIIRGPQSLVSPKIVIPGDISSAAFFLASAILIENSHLIIKKVGVNPTRTGFIEVLKECGANINFLNYHHQNNEPIADIEVRSSHLKPFKIYGDRIPLLIDEIPILTVLATQIEGISEIRDARELRVKETDRIKSMCSELRKMGADIEELEDGMIIKGKVSLKGCVVDSYGDHRTAMSLAIAGLVSHGETIIDNAQCINISFPTFFRILNQIVKR